jgi:tyrosine-protein kinase Etk/Wzc
MKAPRSIIGTIAANPVLARPWLRRGIVVLLAAVCVVLALFPQQYRAAVSLTPTEPPNLSPASGFSQLAVGNVFGNQTAVEVAVRVANSELVRSIVSKKLDLPKVLGKSPTQTHRWLARKIDITTLRGGIIEFEIVLTDPQLALRVVDAYGQAVREHQADISREQTFKKRDILLELIASASDKLGQTQAAYDNFRLQTRYSSPQAAFFAAGDRIPELEALIRAKEVELSAIRQFATDQNIRVLQTRAEIASLQSQLAEIRSLSPSNKSSVGDVVRQSTEAERLKRDLDIARAVYENYKRYLQGTTAEDLTSNVNVRILESAYIDSALQYRVTPLAAALLLLLLAAAVEFYLMRPPLERWKQAA